MSTTVTTLVIATNKTTKQYNCKETFSSLCETEKIRATKNFYFTKYRQLTVYEINKRMSKFLIAFQKENIRFMQLRVNLKQMWAADLLIKPYPFFTLNHLTVPVTLVAVKGDEMNY